MIEKSRLIKRLGLLIKNDFRNQKQLNNIMGLFKKTVIVLLMMMIL